MSDDGATQVKTAERVARRLRRRIASGELVPGDRLPPEDELMSQLGIARTTLREVLRILESQGVVRVQRGRSGGPRITKPPIDRLAEGLALHLQMATTSIGDLDAARQLIEPWLAAELARSHSADDLAALESAIDAAAEAAGRGDQEAFAAAATRVHEAVVERGGNQTLSVIARLLHELVAAYYRRAARKADDVHMQRAVRSYRKLHRLIDVGDGDGAHQHWRRQMTYTISRTDRDLPLELFDPVEG